MRGKLMPLSINSQNNLKFLYIGGEMTNSNRDSRTILPNQIICYSEEKWIDWNQNLVKQMIRWMPLIIKNIKCCKQLTQLDLTWDIFTLHSSCLFSVGVIEPEWPLGVKRMRRPYNQELKVKDHNGTLPRADSSVCQTVFPNKPGKYLESVHAT